MNNIQADERASIFGLVESPNDIRDYNINRLIKTSVCLPESYINPTPLIILDQGDSSECVSCAIAQAKHIIEYRQTEDRKQFSPSFIYGNREDSYYQGEGMIIREALNTLLKKGICHYDEFPGYYSYLNAKNKYQSKQSKLDKISYPYRISSYYRLNSVSEIKTAIYTMGFAIVAYDIYECMYHPDKNGVITYDSKNHGETYGGHSVLAIGWNKDGLIICNSWSSDYGIGFEENKTYGGQMIVPYDYFPTEAWACTDEIKETEVSNVYSNKLNIKTLRSKILFKLKKILRME